MNAQAGGESAPAATEPTTPGELLRRERERRTLSLQQAAEDLHLDVWMIEAIEANRFAALGAPVYARGHLRKYAALLGLSPAFVIERYEALSDTPTVPAPIPATVALPVQRERRSLKAPLWIIAGVLAVAAGWWLFNWYDERPTGAQAPAPAPIVTPADDSAATVLPVADPSGEASPVATQRTDLSSLQENGSVPSDEAQIGQGAVTTATAASEPVAAKAAAPVTDTNAGPVANAAQIRLHLEFSEACWTEVYDAAGRQLMFDLGAPGRARTVAGVPPLRVTLGLASAVTAQVDDRPIIVPRRAGRDAARFVVQADGSVNTE